MAEGRIKRRFVLFTDKSQDAFEELYKRRALGEDGWYMAEVRTMRNPPRTTSRYVVYQTPVKGTRA